MKNRLLLVLCGFGGALLAFHSDARAQEKIAPAAEPVTLESIPGQLAALDAPTHAKVAAFLSAVETEAAAKRISELVATELSWTARRIESSTDEDAMNLLTSARLPKENAALDEAVVALENEISAAQGKRTIVVSRAIEEARKHTREAIAPSQKPRDFAPLISLLRNLSELAGRHSVTGQSPSRSGVLANCSNLLEAVSNGRNAIARNDMESEEAATLQIKAICDSTRDIASFDQAMSPIRAAEEPLRAAIEKAQDALEAAFSGRAPTEIAAALKSLEAAVHAFTPPGFGLKLSAYRALAGIASTPKDPRPNDLSERIAQARAILSHSSLDEARATTLRGFLEKWEQGADAASDNTAGLSEKTLSARLRHAKRASDLEALAIELQRANPAEAHIIAPHRHSDVIESAPLSQFLMSLAAAWSTGNPDFLPYRSDDADSAGVRTEVADLRERVEREVLSRALGIPELNQAPLAGQPLDEVFYAVFDKLAAKGEWRRIWKIAKLEGAENNPRENWHPLDYSLQSIRLFLAGQNFELAGQWASAVRAYKTVIRIAAERAPVPETIERLKIMKKEHPEAFTVSRARADARSFRNGNFPTGPQP